MKVDYKEKNTQMLVLNHAFPCLSFLACRSSHVSTIENKVTGSSCFTSCTWWKIPSATLNIVAASIL
eukprot:m.14694 g.14694  ORF g.14694 m.14694 type:complete len:67 (+) comp4355_c0_seq1:2038-2238(+)